MAEIITAAIGDLPEGMLQTLGRQAAAALGIPVLSRQPRIDAAVAYDERRGQYRSALLLTELRKLQPDPASRVVGAASVDLFSPILTFVFGEAEMPGRVAVFSIHRLRQEFYGLPPDRGLLAERACKEMLHELGHTFGLAHCPDAACVMSSSHSVEAVDAKGQEFCRECRSRLRQAAARERCVSARDKPA